jgi:hypothetical protein
MKLVDPTDPDLIRVMLGAQAKVKAGGRMLPMNDAGKAELLAVIEQTAAELCPLRRFQFRIEAYPGLGVANIMVEEPEAKDIQ